MVWLSVDPDIPQTLSARQYETYSGDCDVYLLWNLPSNIAPDDISHFAIYINGTHVANYNEIRNTSEILTMTVYRLCSCGSHNISISAVNRCGRSGRSILVNVEGQLPIPQLAMECQDKINSTSATTTGGNKYQRMYTEILHL